MVCHNSYCRNRIPGGIHVIIEDDKRVHAALSIIVPQLFALLEAGLKKAKATLCTTTNTNE